MNHPYRFDSSNYDWFGLVFFSSISKFIFFFFLVWDVQKKKWTGRGPVAMFYSMNARISLSNFSIRSRFSSVNCDICVIDCWYFDPRTHVECDSAFLRCLWPNRISHISDCPYFVIGSRWLDLVLGCERSGFEWFYSINVRISLSLRFQICGLSLRSFWRRLIADNGILLVG